MSGGTYVCVKFTDKTVARLQEIQRELKVPFPVPAEKLHSTVVYSRVQIAYVPVYNTHILATKAKLHKFGDALVLLFDSPYLQERHLYGELLGATYDFPEYLPHITLSYDVGAKEYTGEFDVDIEMITEHVSILDSDWNINENTTMFSASGGYVVGGKSLANFRDAYSVVASNHVRNCLHK